VSYLPTEVELKLQLVATFPSTRVPLWRGGRKQQTSELGPIKLIWMRWHQLACSYCRYQWAERGLRGGALPHNQTGSHEKMHTLPTSMIRGFFGGHEQTGCAVHPSSVWHTLRFSGMHFTPPGTQSLYAHLHHAYGKLQAQPRAKQAVGFILQASRLHAAVHEMSCPLLVLLPSRSLLLSALALALFRGTLACSTRQFHSELSPAAAKPAQAHISDARPRPGDVPSCHA